MLYLQWLYEPLSQTYHHEELSIFDFLPFCPPALDPSPLLSKGIWDCPLRCLHQLDLISLAIALKASQIQPATNNDEESNKADEEEEMTGTAKIFCLRLSVLIRLDDLESKNPNSTPSIVVESVAVADSDISAISRFSAIFPIISGFPPALFPSGSFDSVESSHFHNEPSARFVEHQPPANKRKGPVIEEINSDDEVDNVEGSEVKKDNSRKHSRSAKEPYVEEPDDVNQEKKNELMEFGGAFNQTTNLQPQRQQLLQSRPQTQSFTFHSSTVTYGGANGAYYTKSTTKRAGSDEACHPLFVGFEEFKEADSSTGQATHRTNFPVLKTAGRERLDSICLDGYTSCKDMSNYLVRTFNISSAYYNIYFSADCHCHVAIAEAGIPTCRPGDSSWRSAGGCRALPSTQPAPHSSSALPSTPHIQHPGTAFPSTQHMLHPDSAFPSAQLIPHPGTVDPNMGMRTSLSSQPHGSRNPRNRPQGRKRA
ncbi:hypothetical protein AKJ16_DCAP19217 [Drosera capensis]